jgi:hypothetical protein
VSFASEPISGIDNIYDHEYFAFKRTDYQGAAPKFLLTDWELGFRAPYLFYDSFESGTIDNWVDQGGHDVKIVFGGPHGGKGLQLYNSGTFGGVSRDFNGLKPSKIKYYVRSLGGEKYHGYVYLRNNNQQTMAAVYFLGGSVNRFYVSGVQLDKAVTIGAYYHVEITIDWNAKIYDVAIDNVLHVKNKGFVSSTSTSLGRIDLYNAQNGGVQFDRFILEE